MSSLYTATIMAIINFIVNTIIIMTSIVIIISMMIVIVTVVNRCLPLERTSIGGSNSELFPANNYN